MNDHIFQMTTIYTALEFSGFIPHEFRVLFCCLEQKSKNHFKDVFVRHAVLELLLSH